MNEDRCMVNFGKKGINWRKILIQLFVYQYVMLYFVL